METLQEWTNEVNASKKLIIVEGRKDKEALVHLGITNTIIPISNKTHMFFETVQEEVIILTDLDKHGKKLYAKIRNNCEKRRIKVDRKFRFFLQKQGLSHIEGLKEKE